MSDNREAIVLARAKQTRERCICQEEPNASPCDCEPPVTREQMGRLHAYLALHPERGVIYSELVGEWLAVLHAHLPVSKNPTEAWLNDPLNVPTEGELCRSIDLGALLDLLGAPPAATIS